MIWRKIVENYIIFVVASGVILNILARIFGGEEATISVVMKDAGYRWPIVVGVVFGVVCHWYWPCLRSQP